MKHILVVITVLLLSFAAFAQEAGKVVEVVAKGYGVDAQGSLKAALRAAVENVVGQLVDATTLVENDELVEDRILTSANAFVKTYEMVGVPKTSADGLVTTTVKAVVEKGQIAQKVREITKTETAVSGKGLFAELSTRQTLIKDAKAMFDELFQDIPLKLLKADTVKKADGSPSFRLEADSGELLIDVELGIDQEKYAAWTADLMQKLEKMAAKTYSFGVKSFIGSGSSLYLTDYNFSDLNPGVVETWPSKEDLKDLCCYIRVVIPNSSALYDFTESKNRFKIFGYGLSKDVGGALDIGSLHCSYGTRSEFAPADASFTAKVILKDASGNSVAEACVEKPYAYVYDVNHISHFICSISRGELWILPGWIRDDGRFFGSKLEMVVNMGKFDPEELKGVAKIVCEPIRR